MRALRSVVLLIGIIVGAGAAAPRPSDSVASLLDRYVSGDFEGAIAAAPDVDALAKAYPRDASAWIAQVPADVNHRRLAAASFVLEVAVVRNERASRAWHALADTIEWGCAQLRRGDPTPGEETWNRAAVAAAERAGLPWLVGNPLAGKGAQAAHLYHAQPRFPADPYLKLARAMADYPVAEDDLDFRIRQSAPNMLQPRLETITAEKARAKLAVNAFEALADDPLVGADAEARLAHVYLQMHDDQRALTSAQHAAARLPVSEATYQADIIAALAFQRLKRPDDAGRAFAAALDVVPGGQSATLGLSTLLALSGHGSQADQLITRSLAQHPSDDDPWRRFPYGDYVHWNAIVRDLHKTIR